MRSRTTARPAWSSSRWPQPAIRVRCLGDRGGSWTCGQHGARPRKARARGLHRSAHLARARQLRAGAGGGAAGRGPGEIRRSAPAAGHQPRAAPRSGRAGVSRQTPRIGRGFRGGLAGRPGTCPAVRLFLERVRDVQPDFRLTAANGPTVTAICRRLDALPLALELAAPWMKVLTAEELLRRLEHDVLLSTPDRAIFPNASRR